MSLLLALLLDTQLFQALRSLARLCFLLKPLLLQVELGREIDDGLDAVLALLDHLLFSICSCGSRRRFSRRLPLEHRTDRP